MEKTLGGDRLGSGNKMKIHLHGYNRSTHDLGYLWRSTMSPGTCVPFLSEVALPGDTWDINLDSYINTHPTIGPLFGSFKAQYDLFLAPIRLYNSRLHNNEINIGRNMAAIKLPQIQFDISSTVVSIDTIEDLDNYQINPSSLPKYLGISGLGLTDTDQARGFNAVSILAYWDIIKYYYSNKQEEIGAVIHTPVVALVTTVTTVEATLGASTQAIPLSPAVGTANLVNGTYIRFNFVGATPIPSQLYINTQNQGYKSFAELATSITVIAGQIFGQYNWPAFGDDVATQWRYQTASDISLGKPAVATFPLENIDTARKIILADSGADSVDIPSDINITPYIWLTEKPFGVANILSSQEGLALKTYQSDLFNNWLKTEWIDGPGGITEVTSIDTSSGSFSIDTLNLSRKVYDMLNRIAVSGGTYDDWLDAVWAHDRYKRCETPMYMGGLIKELIFQEVVSNAESNGDSGNQPLGTLAGKGQLSKKHKGGHIVIKVDEPSYIIGIVSLTPRIDYSQGNKWDIHLKTMDDLHKPALDEIGFQEAITEDFAWWDTRWNSGTSTWEQLSAGKQPAWIKYMTAINRCYGNFAIPNNEMFMTLNRRYEWQDTGFVGSQIKDLTTYIDPAKYNFIFAQTALDAQNFWTQIAVDITCRRKMSAKLMPNL